MLHWNPKQCRRLHFVNDAGAGSDESLNAESRQGPMLIASAGGTRRSLTADHERWVAGA